MLPTPVTVRFEYWCGNFEPIAHLAPPYGLVVEVELRSPDKLLTTLSCLQVDGETGEILSSLHSTNGAVRFISEAFVYGRLVRNISRRKTDFINFQMDLFRFPLHAVPGPDPQAAALHGPAEVLRRGHPRPSQ